MTNGKVTGVRSIELGVRDLRQSADFYAKAWALEEIAAEGDTMQFRATGGEHHILTISALRPVLLESRFWAIRRGFPAPPAAALASASRRPTDCR